MMIECEFIPRRGATPEQLKALGAALQGWHKRGLNSDCEPEYIDSRALDDLLQGETPQPWSVRLSAMFGDEHRVNGDKSDLTSKRIRDVFPRGADKQSIVVRLQAGPSVSRNRIIDGLRRDIPEDLVDDILVGAKSWEEFD